jgi:hypothetical protein
VLHSRLVEREVVGGHHEGGKAMSIEILDPTTPASPRPIEYSPRPGSLAGKRVALIENTKFNSDKLLQRIGEILKADDIARSIAYAVTQPQHVSVNEVLIRPTTQPR